MKRVQELFKRIANWKNACGFGSVTVMCTLAIVPCLLVVCVFLDGARMSLASSVAKSEADLTLNDALSYNDKTLQDTFGLFGTSQDIDQMTSYFSDEYFKNLTSNQKNDLLRLNADKSTLAFTPVANSNLANPDILRGQVVDYTKYRGVIQLISALKGNSDANGVSKVTEASKKAEEQTEKQIKKAALMKSIGEALKEAKNLKDTISDAKTTVDAAIGNMTAIRDDLKGQPGAMLTGLRSAAQLSYLMIYYADTGCSTILSISDASGETQLSDASGGSQLSDASSGNQSISDAYSATQKETCTGIKEKIDELNPIVNAQITAARNVYSNFNQLRANVGKLKDQSYPKIKASLVLLKKKAAEIKIAYHEYKAAAAKVADSEEELADLDSTMEVVTAVSSDADPEGDAPEGIVEKIEKESEEMGEELSTSATESNDIEILDDTKAKDLEMTVDGVKDKVDDDESKVKEDIAAATEKATVQDGVDDNGEPTYKFDVTDFVGELQDEAFTYMNGKFAISDDSFGGLIKELQDKLKAKITAYVQDKVQGLIDEYINKGINDAGKGALQMFTGDCSDPNSTTCQIKNMADLKGYAQQYYYAFEQFANFSGMGDDHYVHTIGNANLPSNGVKGDFSDEYDGNAFASLGLSTISTLLGLLKTITQLLSFDINNELGVIDNLIETDYIMQMFNDASTPSGGGDSKHKNLRNKDVTVEGKTAADIEYITYGKTGQYTYQTPFTILFILRVALDFAASFSNPTINTVANALNAVPFVGP
jgi:hypothetical protein